MRIFPRSCTIPRKEKTMREYFREEGLRFKYFPPFIFLRLAFIALVFIVGQLQWLLVAASCALSFGFLYDTEAEHMLPLNSEELIARRRLRVRMVWFRYLLICLVSIAIHLLMMRSRIFAMDPQDSALLRRPLIPAFYFVLQMLFVYNILLTAAVTQKQEKKKGVKKPLPEVLERFILYQIPVYVFLIYGVGFCINDYIYYGSQWIHIAIIAAASILLAIYNVKVSKELTLPDFSPAIQKA